MNLKSNNSFYVSVSFGLSWDAGELNCIVYELRMCFFRAPAALKAAFGGGVFELDVLMFTSLGTHLV